MSGNEAPSSLHRTLGANTSRAAIACSSRSATTARKFPSRTNATNPVRERAAFAKGAKNGVTALFNRLTPERLLLIGPSGIFGGNPPNLPHPDIALFGGFVGQTREDPPPNPALPGK